MHRVGTRFAALVAFVLLTAALAAPDIAEPEPPAPTLASFLRGASVGTRLPKEPLLTVWPAIEALWKGADLEVIRGRRGPGSRSRASPIHTLPLAAPGFVAAAIAALSSTA